MSFVSVHLILVGRWTAPAFATMANTNIASGIWLPHASKLRSKHTNVPDPETLILFIYILRFLHHDRFSKHTRTTDRHEIRVRSDTESVT